MKKKQQNAMMQKKTGCDCIIFFIFCTNTIGFHSLDTFVVYLANMSITKFLFSHSMWKRGGPPKADMDKCQEFKFVKKHRKLKMLALSTVSSRRQGLMLNEMPSFFFFLSWISYMSDIAVWIQAASLWPI